jgi:hypothetical protein
MVSKLTKIAKIPTPEGMAEWDRLAARGLLLNASGNRGRSLVGDPGGKEVKPPAGTGRAAGACC